MLTLCQFYGWTLADVRAMSLRDFNSACNYVIEYEKRQAESYKR